MADEQNIRAESLAVYSEPEIVDYYAADNDVQKAEQSIFEYLSDEIADQAVLDIGVGAGRTTPPLLALTTNYTGIDMSPSMVVRCQQRFAGVKFAQCDATDMSRFSDEQFGFALFSYNGIDSVAHEDRLQILREVHRVLKPRGVFVFSAHNRNAPLYTLYDCFPKPVFYAHPLRFWNENVKRISRYLNIAFTHLKHRSREQQTETYALVNDLMHCSRLMMYYISPQDQIEQLRALNFHRVEIVNLDGQLIASSESRDTDAWLYYIARKR